MRNALFPDSRHTTSSRQSPNKSPLRHGVALVPLLEATPAPDSSVEVFPASQFHFVIVVPSSSSRNRSPSHHTPKLIDGLLEEICTPLGASTAFGVESCAVYMPPVFPDAHIS